MNSINSVSPLNLEFRMGFVRFEFFDLREVGEVMVSFNFVFEGWFVKRMLCSKEDYFILLPSHFQE